MTHIEFLPGLPFALTLVLRATHQPVPTTDPRAAEQPTLSSLGDVSLVQKLTPKLYRNLKSDAHLTSCACDKFARCSSKLVLQRWL